MTDPTASRLPIVSPDYRPPREFTDIDAALDEIERRYHESRLFLQDGFAAFLKGHGDGRKMRAFYPEIRIETLRHGTVDSRLSYGYLPGPGAYVTTVTRPDLFRRYLHEQLQLITEHHRVPVRVGTSTTPMPVHFALSSDAGASGGTLPTNLRDHFDVPELDLIDDEIVNSGAVIYPDGARPLGPFTAQRIDYSLARMAHYTATDPEHFQNHVLFTNYHFYVAEFTEFARKMVTDPASGYEALIEPGNVITDKNGTRGTPAQKPPQMPAYHLTRKNQRGITLVNIGVGPSNAKTATDHIAVLRPHAWIMVGHCAGLRNSQNLGDYVLAHAYVREDHVLDADLPTWVPIPALAEIQVALEEAVAEVTSFDGYDLKKIMRTGTVATIDNRNWELSDKSGPVHRLSQSRAIALDMESATIAANGFRFRVPYGTLLCVSDKPLHGELKLPGMASDFYNTQVSQHLKIGIRAMELLREMPSERLHSRKLRSFDETAFL